MFDDYYQSSPQTPSGDGNAAPSDNFSSSLPPVSSSPNEDRPPSGSTTTSSSDETLPADNSTTETIHAVTPPDNGEELPSTEIKPPVSMEKSPDTPLGTSEEDKPMDASSEQTSITGQNVTDEAVEEAALSAIQGLNQDSFFEEIGLKDIPEDQKKKLFDTAIKHVQLRITTRIDDQLSDADKQELTQMINMEKPENEVDQFLTEKVPNYAMIIQEETELMKQELAEDAAQLKAVVDSLRSKNAS